MIISEFQKSILEDLKQIVYLINRSQIEAARSLLERIINEIEEDIRIDEE